jgi:hypothetical protein
MGPTTSSLRRTMPRERRYDLVVAGGGPAGCGAAIAAVRLFARVVDAETDTGRAVVEGCRRPWHRGPHGPRDARRPRCHRRRRGRRPVRRGVPACRARHTERSCPDALRPRRRHRRRGVPPEPAAGGGRACARRRLLLPAQPPRAGPLPQRSRPRDPERRSAVRDRRTRRCQSQRRHAPRACVRGRRHQVLPALRSGVRGRPLGRDRHTHGRARIAPRCRRVLPRLRR